jgi:transcriptional regulator with XRE-family HTH domain
VPKSLRSKGHRALVAVLVATRRDAGITQSQLAERLKRSQSFVAKIEAGERRLDTVEFVDWVKALKADPVETFRRFVSW